MVPTYFIADHRFSILFSGKLGRFSLEYISDQLFHIQGCVRENFVKWGENVVFSALEETAVLQVPSFFYFIGLQLSRLHTRILIWKETDRADSAEPMLPGGWLAIQIQMTVLEWDYLIRTRRRCFCFNCYIVLHPMVCSKHWQFQHFVNTKTWGSTNFTMVQQTTTSIVAWSETAKVDQAHVLGV